ncbi:MAG: response regulator transcription factor [Chromatiales bacterium]|nr:response regulator transcription factor [Chromatiales bacterium]
MKILIADDHPLVRRGIKDLLKEAFPEASIGEASDIAEAIEAVRRAAWDIVLLDLSMPGITGLEGLIKLKRACSATPILVLSMHSEEQYAVRALKSGAMGYLTKDHSGRGIAQSHPLHLGREDPREMPLWRSNSHWTLTE